MIFYSYNYNQKQFYIFNKIFANLKIIELLLLFIHFHI